MGRPPGEPSKVVRLPLPVAALAKRLAEKSLRAGDINAFFDIEARRAATVPLMATSAACGFPSPADDYLDRPLDFNELLIENPAATFAVRIAGESMTGAGPVSRRYRRRRSRATGCRWLDRAGPAGGRIHGRALSQEGRADLAASREPGV
jgi:DNA polymerase V